MLARHSHSWKILLCVLRLQGQIPRGQHREQSWNHLGWMWPQELPPESRLDISRAVPLNLCQQDKAPPARGKQQQDRAEGSPDWFSKSFPGAPAPSDRHRPEELTPAVTAVKYQEETVPVLLLEKSPVFLSCILKQLTLLLQQNQFQTLRNYFFSQTLNRRDESSTDLITKSSHEFNKAGISLPVFPVLPYLWRAEWFTPALLIQAGSEYQQRGQPTSQCLLFLPCCFLSMRPSTEHGPFLGASAQGTAAAAAPAVSPPPREGCPHSQGLTSVLRACQPVPIHRGSQVSSLPASQGSSCAGISQKPALPDGRSQNPTPRQRPKTSSCSQGCSGASGEACGGWIITEDNNLCICVHLLPS